MKRLLVSDRLSGFTDFDCSVAPLTTWGVGGVAKLIFSPKNEDELVHAAQWLFSEGLDFFTLAGGSNTLVADGYIDRPFIHMKSLGGIAFHEEDEDVFLECAAGVDLKTVFAKSLREGWSGLEFAAGIPGTVGGALMGNAGTSGGDIGNIVHRVRSIEHGGTHKIWQRDDIEWAYRKSSLSDDPQRIISGATLKLKRSDREAVLSKAKGLLMDRKKQPLGRKTAGCVFKNPVDASAGKLIDMAGCKNLTIGGARVSPVHANFIENFADCSAKDIVKLAFLCKNKVYDKFDVVLDFEIKFVGFSANLLNG